MKAAEIVAEVRSRLPAVTSEIDLTRATFGDQYRDRNRGAAGIREAHARAALKDPDAVEAFSTRDGSQRVVLVTKRIQIERPFTMLFELSDRQTELTVDHGWRIYDDSPPPTPLECFAQIVERFGIVLRVGGLIEAKFVAALTVPGFKGNPAEILGFVEEPTDTLIGIGGRVRPMENGDVEVAWAYGLDEGAYERSVAGLR